MAAEELDFPVYKMYQRRVKLLVANFLNARIKIILQEGLMSPQ